MINFGIKFFVSPTLTWVTWWTLHLSQFTAKLKIYHLSSLITKQYALNITNHSSMQDACHYEPRKWPHSLWGFCSSVVRALSQCLGGHMGLNPFGDSDFFLCSTQAHDMMNITIDLFSVQLMFFGKFVSSNWLWLRTTFISLAVMYSSAALAGSVESHILKTTTIQEITMCIHVQL